MGSALPACRLFLGPKKLGLADGDGSDRDPQSLGELVSRVTMWWPDPSPAVHGNTGYKEVTQTPPGPPSL